MIASYHRMSLRTGEYIGNFVEIKKGIITHFSSGSFSLWMKNADIENLDLEVVQAITQGEDELVVQFEFDNKKHQLPKRIWNLTGPGI